MSYRTSRRDLVRHGLMIAAATGVAPILGSSSGTALSFAEYRSYDALGLAQLVRNRDVSAVELLELAIARSEAINPRVNYLVEELYAFAREAIDAGLPQGPSWLNPLKHRDRALSRRNVVLRRMVFVSAAVTQAAGFGVAGSF